MIWRDDFFSEECVSYGRASSFAWDTNLSALEKLIFLALADGSSIDRVAERCAVSVECATNVAWTLRREGHLEAMWEHASERSLPKRAPQERVGTVYIAHANYGKLKIGFTAGAVQNRMRQLTNATGGDVTLMASCAGTRRLEQQIHERFAEYRLEGEWFEDCAPIRDWIRSWQK